MTKKSNGRLRVFFAEFEGDDETIQEGLRAIGAAVNKTFQPRIVRALPSVEQRHVNGYQPDDEISVDDFDEEVDAENTFDARPAKQRSRPKRRPQSLSIVPDLNLRPQEEQSWREFHNERQPKSQQEHIVVAVYYLRRKLQIEGVTVNHVFTCFKDVGERVPNDLAQTIRNTSNRKAWLTSSNSNAIDITTQGENFVEHDLPQGNGE